jgi:putative endonuclease
MKVMWFVYILECSDSSFYTGCTSDLEERLLRHSLGQIHYTSDKLPVKLVSLVAFSNKYKAFEFEKYLKSGSGIAFRNKRLI